jgi:hypothetical protein
MAVSVVQALGRRLDAPRVARAHVRDFLLDLDSADLVTNAVLHGTGQVQLRLEMVDGAVSVGVLDGGRAQPRPPGRGHGAESGRGLALVAGLTRDWGIRPDSTGGKEVWAVFPPEPTS